ncbi:hypothetical protein [Petralouisia muris]|uniref:hypothetical protein n=1 Tax=Petralouisia muris TaxID=3032872 RepID=UPI0023B86653|nr:hypothetical protein [Petralouisia muris]
MSYLKQKKLLRREKDDMLKCDRDEQWAESLSLWVDRKVVTYLRENHARFEAILTEQGRLAEKYPVIVPFLDGEGAMELTAEEHAAVKEYLDLREKTELLIREYHYYLGQAMDIPGRQEFGIRQDGKPGAGEKRTGELLDLLAANRIEEADQMLRFSNPEYRARAELEAEAQKAVASLQITDETRSCIAHYADAIHGRWLMFLKLFYQYAAEDILSPPKKTGGIAGLLKKGARLWHYRKRCRERQREKGTVGAGETDHAASGGNCEGESRKRKRS